MSSELPVSSCVTRGAEFLQITLLLELGADRALRDEDGKAAVDFCAKNKAHFPY